jgi:hypothetical protein
MYPGRGPGDIPPGAYFQECPSEAQNGAYFRFLPLTLIRVLPRAESANIRQYTEMGANFHFLFVHYMGVILTFLPIYLCFFMGLFLPHE